MKYLVTRPIELNIEIEAIDENDAMTQFYELTEPLDEAINVIEEEHECDNYDNDIVCRPIPTALDIRRSMNEDEMEDE